MRRGRRIFVIGATTVVIALITFVVLSENGVFNTEVWHRENPLAAPIAVTGVQDGTLTLADGRSLRPAGVSRPDTVAVADLDSALRTIASQGVVVVRELGDGSALLLAEPKFYNWCGTRNYQGNPWKRWAGSYIQCPISELLIYAGYAKPDLDQTGLSEIDRWRLEGVEHLCGIADSPTRIADELGALRYDGHERYFTDYDHLLEMMWKPPPPP